MPVPSSVPKATPSAVSRNAGTVAINRTPLRGPHKPMSGKSFVPAVPRTDEPDPLMSPQPGYGTAGTTGTTPGNGSGAPSVPVDGFLFRAPPIDVHYLSEAQAYDPYKRVNSPPTRGLFTWVKAYANHVFNGKQNVDLAGWQQSSPQQRTSWMRITPPAHGIGYAPETFTPRQLPQSDATQKFLPATGTSAPGPRVLNSSIFGAGQTAGGIGGQLYTPQPGPPPTTSTAGASANPSGMPTWG